MGSTEDTWKKFCAKSLYEQLTENLYSTTKYSYGKNALYYLLDNDFKGDLDKCQVAKAIYKTYKLLPIACIDNDSLSGDVLNSFLNLFKRYIFSIQNDLVKNEFKWEKMHIVFCGKNYMPTVILKAGKKKELMYKEAREELKKIEIRKKYEQTLEKISDLAKMYFHLITTIGNIMPWINGFNPNGGLDVFQYKAPKFFALCKWMGQRYDDFVDNHYLQDFVNDDKTKALRFLNLDKIEEVENEIKEKKKDVEKAGEKEKEELHKKIEELEKVWNLYFYRASKAIMKRSYRILKNEEIKDGKLSEEQENEFNKKFQEFCEECKVKQELVGLIKKLDKNDDTDNEGGKPEMLELDELIKKLDNLIEQL